MVEGVEDVEGTNQTGGILFDRRELRDKLHHLWFEPVFPIYDYIIQRAGGHQVTWLLGTTHYVH